jgi:GTP cyclohydrolase I
LAALKPLAKPLAPLAPPSQEEAEAAVRTLLRFAGEDPLREGLQDTPARVVRAMTERFAGYGSDPKDHLARTFSEVGGYEEMVVLSGIRLVSTCEHHMLPIVGVAHVGYLPRRRVVGISKLARVVDGFARRLQIQEKLTAEIADAIWDALDPLGVAVAVEAEHACMTLRGVLQAGARMTTSRFRGVLRDDPAARAEFLRLAGL